MPKQMPKDATCVYRTVITFRKRRDGSVKTLYWGPYFRRNDASARVTVARKECRRGEGTDYGWEVVRSRVEYAELGPWIGVTSNGD